MTFPPKTWKAENFKDCPLLQDHFRLSMVFKASLTLISLSCLIYAKIHFVLYDEPCWLIPSFNHALPHFVPFILSTGLGDTSVLWLLQPLYVLGLQYLTYCHHSPSLDSGAVLGEWYFIAMEFSIYFITNKVVLGHMTVLISHESTSFFTLAASYSPVHRHYFVFYLASSGCSS